MRLILTFLLSTSFVIISQAQTWTTDLAKPDGGGCLTYAEDAEQNRIPDFSYAGYKGGGEAIPTVPTMMTISPISGDNTTHIQDAIDIVAAMPIQANGYRGALLLTEGTYEVSGELLVNASGVVLRGEGDGTGGGKNTIIMGTGNVPHQRNLITLGGGSSTRWGGQVAGTKQDITSTFVQVGAHSFDVADASAYSVGDNIIINHPCSAGWLAAVNYGDAVDPLENWTVDSYPIIFNRYITNISGNTITIDAPVYNHLDRSLSQSYIYKYDRAGLLTNIGIENLTVDNEYTGITAYAGNPNLTDENHVKNSIQLTQVEDAWVQNCTMLHFVLSGVRTETASRITVRNCRSWDPIGEIIGGRMYNFNCYAWSNNILFDNCHARNGRHHFVSNGVASTSGFVVLRSLSENPYTSSEGHRHWTTGMLFDNLVDYGSIPPTPRSMGFYNRGDMGTGHGWSAAHSVFWGCSTTRVGGNAEIVVEKPPTAQNYAIGCFGSIHGDGPYNQADGYIEGSNRYDAKLEPASLYEAQLLCRKATVISDFSADILKTQLNEAVTFTTNTQGTISSYTWQFGQGASPASAIGIGPHEVTYSSAGEKTISLTVSDGINTHTESKLNYVEIVANGPSAIADDIKIALDEQIDISILANDSWTDFPTNNALQFDGLNDKVITDAGGVCNVYPFTMMAWIKTTSTSEDVIMYTGSKSSGVSGNTIGVYNGKARLQAARWDGTTFRYNIDGTTIVNDGNWHHIIGVFESPTSRRLYVDGNLEGTGFEELDNFTAQTVNSTSLGNRDDSTPGNWFTGTIDDAKIITTPLIDSEIAEYMNNSRANTTSNTILGWMLDEGTGTTVSDEGTNSNSGTIDGAIWVPSNIQVVSPIIEIIEQPKNGSYTLANSTITYTPNASFEGLDSLKYKITDETGLSSSAWVNIEIGNVPLHDKAIIGYYANWQYYDRGNAIKPTNLDYSKYTILNYSFFVPDANGNVVSTDTYVDELVLKGEIDWSTDPYTYKPNTSLIDLSHANNVKVMVSIGGWSGSEDFPAIAADAVKRTSFVSSCMDLIREYDFDGVDIDWEYPGYAAHNGTPQDKQNFTLLMQEIRDSLNILEIPLGKDLLLTAAFGATASTADNIEWENIAPIMDYINMMTYDFFGAYASISTHNSPLGPPSVGDNSCIQNTVDMLINTYGVPKEKINAGIAFYGISVTACTDIYSSHSGSNDIITFPDDAGVPTYYNIVAKLQEFDRYWDSDALSPYLLGKTINTYVSYDDEQSIGEIAKYVVDKNIAGVIIWEISGDYIDNGNGTYSTPLADTITSTFINYGGSSTVAQTIQLQAGWNLISINVIPGDGTDAMRRVSTVFAGLDVDIIKDANNFWKAGQAPELNGLAEITVGEGYLVKMNTGGTLTLQGFQNLGGLKTIQSGWQMLGCPYQTATPFTTDFNSTNTETIKNFEGFWEPIGTLNSITDLEPGKGYFMKGK